jgi:hypothetical protein
MVAKNNSSTSLSICDNDVATYMNGNSGEHRSTSILLINGKLAKIKAQHGQTGATSLTYNVVLIVCWFI